MTGTIRRGLDPAHRVLGTAGTGEAMEKVPGGRHWLKGEGVGSSLRPSSQHLSVPAGGGGWAMFSGAGRAGCLGVATTGKMEGTHVGTRPLHVAFGVPMWGVKHRGHKTKKIVTVEFQVACTLHRDMIWDW